MVKFFRLLEDLDYMRLVLGICIVVDGYPLIFFFRETLRLAPGSTTFTALGLGMGLVLMVPFTLLRRLYRPNVTMLWMGVAFLLLSIFYMYVYLGDPGFKDYTKDMIYYVYVFIFLFLLINVPNDIIRVFLPVVVGFTLVSNLALVYSLITNPSWSVGMRATITLGDNDDGSGNPHAFARNAFMGIVASVIWLFQPRTNYLFRLLSLFSAVFSLAILVLTQTRSSIVALMIALGFFILFNVRPAQIRQTVRSLVKPVPVLTALAGIGFLLLFLRRYDDVYGILYGYVLNFAERNLENVYALLGLKAKGAAYQAALDASAANRSVSAQFLSNILVGHLERLILGYGYKNLYLDVPLIESLTNQGLLGFVLFGGVNAMVLYYAVGIMQRNPNPLSIFLAYFYVLILVQLFTNGRPYDISFWFPLALMTRFMGVDHLFPAYLSNYYPIVDNERYEVVAPTAVAT